MRSHKIPMHDSKYDLEYNILYCTPIAITAVTTKLAWLHSLIIIFLNINYLKTKKKKCKCTHTKILYEPFKLST